MGLAISSFAALLANPGANFTAGAAATNDSLQVPSFPLTAQAFLTSLIRGGATAGGVRVLSARLHDQTRGITLYTDKAHSIHQFPKEVGQPLYPGDTLGVQFTGGTAETDDAILTAWFSDLPGVNARLATWDQIKASVAHVKPVVTTPDPDTAGQWATVALNSTEDLLEAGMDYAVLGFQNDAAIDAVAIQGPDTGNLRIACPGDDSTIVTSDYFIKMAVDHGIPYIPIINANNKAATNVCAIDATATAEPNTQVILAQLSTPFTG